MRRRNVLKTCRQLFFRLLSIYFDLIIINRDGFNYPQFIQDTHIKHSDIRGEKRYDRHA